MGAASHSFSVGMHLVDEAGDVALGLLVGHAAVAEVGREAGHADGLADVVQLLQHLLGRAPGHEVHEVLDRPVGAVTADVAGDRRVELVARHALVGRLVERVVAQDRAVVLADVLVGQLLGPVGVLVDEEEAAADRAAGGSPSLTSAHVSRYTAKSSRTISHGFWTMTSSPTPSSAMIGMESGETAAA